MSPTLHSTRSVPAISPGSSKIEPACEHALWGSRISCHEAKPETCPPDLDLTVEVAAQQSLDLSLYGEVEIVTEFVDVEGAAVPSQAPDLCTWRARFGKDPGRLRLRSRARGLTLVLTPRRPGELFQPDPVPVNEVELLEEGSRRGLRTPLLAPGRWTYPEFPGIPPVPVAADELVGLGGLTRFRLRSLGLDTETAGLEVRLQGLARRARTEEGGSRTDRRLTLFQVLYHRPDWRVLAAATAWLLSTTWFLYKCFKKITE